MHQLKFLFYFCYCFSFFLFFLCTDKKVDIFARAKNVATSSTTVLTVKPNECIDDESTTDFLLSTLLSLLLLHCITYLVFLFIYIISNVYASLLLLLCPLHAVPACSLPFFPFISASIIRLFCAQNFHSKSYINEALATAERSHPHIHMCILTLESTIIIICYYLCNIFSNLIEILLIGRWSRMKLCIIHHQNWWKLMIELK